MLHTTNANDPQNNSTDDSAENNTTDDDTENNDPSDDADDNTLVLKLQLSSKKNS